MKILNLIKLTVVTGTLLTLTARAGIIGSPHDFSGQSWNNNLADPNTICSVCHTPHHADPTAGPLWNHTPTLTAGFKMYGNSTAPGANVRFTPALIPNASSLACLSCHDGTVAINSYGGGIQGGGGMVTITNSADLTKDLSHSHPISFTYDSTLVSQDKWLQNPDTFQVLQPVGSPFVPGLDMTVNGFLLNGNHTVECSSCHDVHNQEGSPYDTTYNPHLVKINGVDGQIKGSLLCRSCHNK